MNVIVIPALSDNFCYYVYTSDIKDGFLVDASKGETIIQAMHKFGITPKTLLNTHKHWDHTGGNEMLL